MSDAQHGHSARSTGFGRTGSTPTLGRAATNATAVITVLLVDDNEATLIQLQQILEAAEHPFRIRKASNGQDAISILQTSDVDVVITDLSMPFGDGFSLLTFIKRAQSNLPVLVVTGMAPADYAARLDPFGSITVIAKPIDHTVLQKELDKLLDESSSGELHGVTLSGFLQLIAMERKSCSVRVRSGRLVGRLHFKSGHLVNAYTFDDDLEGEAAARRIMSWQDVDIEVERSYHNHRLLIETPLPSLLLAAAVERDERSHAQQLETDNDAEPGAEPRNGRDRAADTTTEERGDMEPNESAKPWLQPSDTQDAEHHEERLHHDLHQEHQAPQQEQPWEHGHQQAAEDQRFEGAQQETDEATDVERDMRTAVERLSQRAQQLDEAVDQLKNEVGVLLETRKRLQDLEQAQRERRKELESVRDVLQRAVSALNEKLG